MFKRVLLFLITIFSSSLFAQTNGVTLLGHLDVPHGTSGQGTHYSSCWGYVAPDGKEYAMIGCYTGTSFIDLNSDSLREVAFIPGPMATWCYRGFRTYKHYAYIISEGSVRIDSVTYSGVGVQVVDLSHLPDSAVLVNEFIYRDSETGKRGDRSHTLSFSDGYLYCNGGSWNGTVIFSLREDPTNPQYAGHYDPPEEGTLNTVYFHDTYIRNDTLYGAAIYNALVNGKQIGGVYIADVRDKANPIQIGRIIYDNSNTHNVWTSVDRKYVFTTDENGVIKHSMKVWALDSLPNSVQVAEYQAEPTSSIHNVYIRGQYVYAAHYTAGMRVVDVHDPRNPVEVGSYDTYRGASGGYRGCWDVYPYFPSGKLIGSDMDSGLYVCKFDGLKPRTRVYLLAPADSAVPSFSEALRWSSSADQTDDPHFYRVHILGSGIDTILRTNDTAMTLQQMSFLPQLQMYSWHVMSTDEFTEVNSVDTLHFLMPEALGVHNEKHVPETFSLKQNYPNPFNPTTKIEFALPVKTTVTLEIYDALGKKVRTLLNHQSLSQGNHEFAVDASNLSSGMYFYRLISPVFVQTRRMVITK